MKKEKPSFSVLPIQVKDAIAQAGYWRKYLKGLIGNKKDKHGKPLPVINAFFIPFSDLDKIREYAQDHPEEEVVGIRAYLRLEKESDDLSNVKLMVVPVLLTPNLLYKKDKLKKKKGDADSDGESLVYDFTMPCPTECDNESDLLNPPSLP